jgi:hypothetical protein
MTKLLFALLILCSPVMAETEVKLPSYCIRSVVINDDGTFLLDMPGYPYGMDDEPMLVTSMDRLENVTNCTPDDPRMNR